MPIKFIIKYQYVRELKILKTKKKITLKYLVLPEN